MKKIVAIALTMLSLSMSNSYGTISAEQLHRSPLLQKMMKRPMGKGLQPATPAQTQHQNAVQAAPVRGNQPQVASTAAAAVAHVDAKEAKPSLCARFNKFCGSALSACGSVISTGASWGKWACGLPYNSTDWLLSHTILYKGLVGETPAKVVAALGLIAAAIFTPALAPLYMHEIVSAITVLSTVYMTTGALEAFCRWYGTFYKTHPKIATLFAPVVIALVAVAMYVDAAGITSKALDLSTKAFDMLPTGIVDAGRNAASMLNIFLDRVGLHINPASIDPGWLGFGKYIVGSN